MDAPDGGAGLEFAPLPQQPEPTHSHHSAVGSRILKTPAEEGADVLPTGSQLSYVETAQSILADLPANTPHATGTPASAHGLLGQQAPLAAMDRALGGDSPHLSGWDTGFDLCGFEAAAGKDCAPTSKVAAAPEDLLASPNHHNPDSDDGLNCVIGEAGCDAASGDTLMFSRSHTPPRREGSASGESPMPGAAQVIWSEATGGIEHVDMAFPHQRPALLASDIRSAFARYDRPALPFGPIAFTLFRPSGVSQTEPEGECGRGPQPAVGRLLAADGMAGSEITVAATRSKEQLATPGSAPNPGVDGHPTLEALVSEGLASHSADSVQDQSQVAGVSVGPTASLSSEKTGEEHRAPVPIQRAEPGDRGPSTAMVIPSTNIKPRTPEIQVTPRHHSHLSGMSVPPEKKDTPLEGRGPIREIRLVVQAATGKQVSLSFRESSGGVKVTASTPDRQLAEGLIAELGALKSLGYEELQTGQGQARYALHQQQNDPQHDHTDELAERSGMDHRHARGEDSSAEDERESLTRWLDAMDYQSLTAPATGEGDER